MVPIEECRGRGGGKKSQAALKLLAAAVEHLTRVQPTTGRGVGYYLLGLGVIADMDYGLNRVYANLRDARLSGVIPWDWIVDENRELEREATWHDLPDYLDYGPEWYRRDPWDGQEHRVEVWSEKGTVRGILAPVLQKYRAGFRVHSTTSWSALHDIATSMDHRKLHVLYVGDWDPTGVWLSEEDLPTRLRMLAEAPGGVDFEPDDIVMHRIALAQEDCHGSRKLKLPQALSAKPKDARAKAFVQQYGPACWELDAMDPRVLRNRVEREIVKLIDQDAWGGSLAAEERERLWLGTLPAKWKRTRTS